MPRFQRLLVSVMLQSERNEASKHKPSKEIRHASTSKQEKWGWQAIKSPCEAMCAIRWPHKNDSGLMSTYIPPQTWSSYHSRKNHTVENSIVLWTPASVSHVAKRTSPARKLGMQAQTSKRDEAGKRLNLPVKQSARPGGRTKVTPA